MAAAELAKQEELLQTLITGLSSSSDDQQGAGGYMGQLADAKAQLSAVGTETEQAKVKISLAEKEIKEKEPRAKKAEKEGEGLVKELEMKKKEVEVLHKRLEKMGFDERGEEEKREQRRVLGDRLMGLMEVSGLISNGFASLGAD
jgi:structural maintenance of chromosome 2